MAAGLSNLHKAISSSSDRSFACTLVVALVIGVALVIITMCGIYAAQMGTALYLPAVLPSIAAIICMIPFMIISVKHESKNNRERANLENQLVTILAPLEGQQNTKEELVTSIKECIKDIPRYNKDYLLNRLKENLLPKGQYPAINEALGTVIESLYPKDEK